MTVAEIADTLKLNQQTIRNWIAAGRLPHLRIGERRVRIYRSDFERLLKDSEPAPEKPELERSIWDGWIPDPAQ